MKRSCARRTCSPRRSRARVPMQAWIEGHQAGGAARHGELSSTFSASARCAGARSHRRTTSPAALPVIVLSHRAWSLHFGRSRRYSTAPVRVNGAQFQIVGVMPEGFRGLEAVAAPDFWAPLSLLGQFRPGQREREESRRRPHCRAAEARYVARPGARAAPRVGLAACAFCRPACRELRRAAREPRARTEAGHGPAVDRRHARCSCRSFLRSA